MNQIQRVGVAASWLVAPLLCGCGGIGARTVPPDRFDYVEALSTSWKQQMLANVVKLRYGDSPVFLDVASVINQYQVETLVDLRLTWVDPVVNVGDSQSTGGSARYIDRPTITYMPLTGERFARSLMKPIPPPALLSLIEAGYPIDVVLRTCVNSINGVRNRYGGAARARPADPEFYPVLARLRKMQNSGQVGLRFQKTDEMEGVVMAFRGNGQEALGEDAIFVRKALGLDLSAQEFRVAYGSIAKDDKEIAILSRSILEILVDLASYIDVPAGHVRDKRVNPTMPAETSEGAEIPALIRIGSSVFKPGNAFIAIPYRNHWFWIDDRDLPSKSLFTFMMFIFSLTETGGRKVRRSSPFRPDETRTSQGDPAASAQLFLCQQITRCDLTGWIVPPASQCPTPFLMCTKLAQIAGSFLRCHRSIDGVPHPRDSRFEGFDGCSGWRKSR